MLRQLLSELVATDGDDSQLAKAAVSLSGQWLENRGAITPEMVKIVLSIAARHGERSMFDRFLQAAEKSEDRAERFNLMGALGSFADPELEKAALSLILTDDIDPRESINIFRAAVIEPDTAERFSLPEIELTTEAQRHGEKHIVLTPCLCASVVSFMR